MIDFENMTRDRLEALCREHARGEPGDRAGARWATAVVLGGIEMRIAPEDKGITEHLLRDGFWESWVTLAAGRRVQRRMREAEDPRRVRVLNIGANMGYYTCLFAALGAQVLAVEPQPWLLDHLLETVRINAWERRVRTLQGVVGETGGFVDLYVPPEHNYGGASLQAQSGTPIRARQYRLDRLDEDILHTRDPVEYIFCDAEGWEPHIFQPAEAYLRTHKPVVTMEFSPSRYDDPHAFASWWKDIGYEALLVEHDGIERPIDISYVALTEREFCTLTMVPR